MKLSISNIAWSNENDEDMYEYIANQGFQGIEIAPTRVIPLNPYTNLEQARRFKKELYQKYHLTISSMQSIWYGKSEKIFGSQEEREELLQYTKKAIDFAKAINCKNLVFGCPRNRVITDAERDYPTAIEFFSKIGDYAKENEVIFAIEPNPTIYHTNFINTTMEAIQFVRKIEHSNIKVNLDLGTMIQNGENANILKGNVELIHHVHISEPNLEYIQKRSLHREVMKILEEENYNHYVSIEMKNQNDIKEVKNIIHYVKNII